MEHDSAVADIFGAVLVERDDLVENVDVGSSVVDDDVAEIASVTVGKWSRVGSVDLVGSGGEMATVTGAFV